MPTQMSGLEPSLSHCPYCAEPIELVIDCSIEEQHYIEDCFVCCRPIDIQVVIDIEGLPVVTVKSENEI